MRTKSAAMAAAIFVLVCFSSCGPEPNDEGLYGPVDKVLVYEVEVDENGEEAGEKSLSTESTYNDKGLVTKVEYYFMGDVYSTSKYKYNDNDRITRYTSSDMDGNTTFRIEYSYNAHGVIDGTEITDYQSQQKSKGEFVLSPDGRRAISAKMISAADGEIVTEIKYDDRNRIVWIREQKTEYRPLTETSISYGSGYLLLEVVRSSIDDEGKVSEKTEEKYDGKGNQLSSKTFDADGKLIAHSEYEYGDLDEHGNWTECRRMHWKSEYDSDELRLVSITTREIEYR